MTKWLCPMFWLRPCLLSIALMTSACQPPIYEIPLYMALSLSEAFADDLSKFDSVWHAAIMPPVVASPAVLADRCENRTVTGEHCASDYWRRSENRKAAAVRVVEEVRRLNSSRVPAETLADRLEAYRFDCIRRDNRWICSYVNRPERATCDRPIRVLAETSFPATPWFRPTVWVNGDADLVVDVELSPEAEQACRAS